MQDAQYEQLTCSQKKAVFHLKGPLLVIAGPGSGKTRVITHRIAALIDSGVRPQNICAITFTNKAADEMRQRAIAFGASAGAHISTFHSLCVRILRRYVDRAGGSFAGSRLPKAGIRPNFSIFNEADQRRCIKQALKDCQIDTKNFPPVRMLGAISTLKNQLINVDAFKKEADDFFSKTLAKIYDRYQAILCENNALDFDDLLMQTAFLLQSCSDVRSELAGRFKFVLIDEYQDTNYAQYRIARDLVRRHNNICVTGDPDQSIYRWRGADINNILNFEKDWPDALVVKLEKNFRSTANILWIADNLIALNRNRKEKTLVPTKPAGRDVEVNFCEDEIEEAGAVVEKITELVEQGGALKDIAVFYRVNAMSRVLEEVFIRQKIPYQVVRGVEFYNRKEIRDLLAYLKILVNPSDEIALLRIINTPARGIGKTTIEKVRGYAALKEITFYDALRRAGDIDSLAKATVAKIKVFVNMLEQFKKDIEGPVGPLAERIFAESGFEKVLQAGDIKDQSALDNVNELLNAAAQYDRQTEQPSLLDYLQQIALFTDSDAYDDAGRRVAFMTLHAAKGLEFENVFIIGLEDGLLPHERGADDEDELEEERRLFFVGITRAKSGLYISHARYRTFRGQMHRTIPSQFLYELGIDFSEPPEENYTISDDDDNGDETARQFSKGQMVQHNIFGTGRVKQFIDMGKNSLVVVRFNTGQTRTLMVKYAGLSKI